MDRCSTHHSTHVDCTVNTSFIAVDANVLRPFVGVALESTTETTPALFALVLTVGDESTLVRPLWSMRRARHELVAAMELLIRFKDADPQSFYSVAQVTNEWTTFVEACRTLPLRAAAEGETVLPITLARELASIAPQLERVEWVTPGSLWTNLQASARHLAQLVSVFDALHAVSADCMEVV